MAIRHSAQMKIESKTNNISIFRLIRNWKEKIWDQRISFHFFI